MSHGIPRVDDVRVISGIIPVIRYGLQWKDAPKDYGPHKTFHNRFVRWSRAGIFNKIFRELARQPGVRDCLPDDRRHPSTGSPHGGESAEKGAVSRCLGCTKGGLNSRLHAVGDETGKPGHLLLTAGHTSDYTGARCLLPSLSNTKHLIADHGYDADWFITARKKQGVTPCFPLRKHRTTRRRYNKTLYKQPHKIEIMFGRIKDWRRIALRYDRCAHTFFSAICLAATVIFYLKE